MNTTIAAMFGKSKQANEALRTFRLHLEEAETSVQEWDLKRQIAKKNKDIPRAKRAHAKYLKAVQEVQRLENEIANFSDVERQLSLARSRNALVKANKGRLKELKQLLNKEGEDGLEHYDALAEVSEMGEERDNEQQLLDTATSASEFEDGFLDSLEDEQEEEEYQPIRAKAKLLSAPSPPSPSPAIRRGDLAMFDRREISESAVRKAQENTKGKPITEPL